MSVVQGGSAEALAIRAVALAACAMAAAVICGCATVPEPPTAAPGALAVKAASDRLTGRMQPADARTTAIGATSAALTQQGERAMDRGEMADAREWFLHARRFAEYHQLTWRDSAMALLEARVLIELGRYREATEVCDRALFVLSGAGDPRAVIGTIAVRGLARANRGDETGARQDFEVADSLLGALDGASLEPRQALAYAELAVLLGRRGRLGDVRLALSSRHEDQLAAEAQALQGDLDSALTTRGRSLEELVAVRHKVGVVRELIEIAELYLDVGRLDLALALGEFARKHANGRQEPRLTARAEVVVGRVSEQLGRRVEAARHYRAAVDWVSNEAKAETHWAVRGLWRLCQDGSCTGRRELAPEMHFPGHGRRRGFAVVAEALVARELVWCGEREEASRRAVAISRVAPTVSLPSRFVAHHTLGLTYRELGDRARARVELERAVTALEELHGELQSPVLRRALLARNRAVFEDLVDARIGRSGAATPADDRADGLEAAERSRGRSSLDLLTSFDADGRRTFVKTASVTRLLARQLRKSKTAEDAPSVWEVAATAATLSRIAGKPSTMRRSRTFAFGSLTESLQKELAEDTALLSWSVGAGRSYLWIVRRHDVRLLLLPGVETIGPAFERYRSTLLALELGAAGWKEHVRTGLALSKMLLGDGEEALADPSITRLVVAPDFPIYGLPMGSLMLSSQEKCVKAGCRLDPTYLVERFAVTHVASGAVWLSLKQRARDRRNKQASRRRLLAVGAPDHRLVGGGPLQVTVELHDGGVTFVTDSGLDSAVPSLPHARWEIDAAAAPFGKRAVVLTGNDATEGNFVGADPATFDYIHFATHGVSDATPLLPPEVVGGRERSSLARAVFSQPALLLTANSADRDAADDGMLRVEEVLGLELTADLVTLSGCGTGRGWDSAGYDSYGLGGAFVQAGSRRAVVSLWSVADQAASQLMVALYRNLQKGLAPDEALRQAQLTMMGRKRTAGTTTRGFGDIVADPPKKRNRRTSMLPPFYWAPFVVLGD